jgi:hypothetical protein
MRIHNAFVDVASTVHQTSPELVLANLEVNRLQRRQLCAPLVVPQMRLRRALQSRHNLFVQKVRQQPEIYTRQNILLRRKDEKCIRDLCSFFSSMSALLCGIHQVASGCQR